MITVPFEQAQFVPVSAARPNGAQLAVLRGDPATGPSAMLMKLVRGPVPLHTHSADYHLVLIREHSLTLCASERFDAIAR